ncbi:phosphohydrolase [Deinococcus arcticus]|uniref:Phosphohydrolase n=1 Tax=Deinococcus arcticus TaxID=2136176 RepID=A0A2T3WAL8_9DEIO|nr:phosphohydrolase [Deinococcus arcticus]
MQAMLDALGSRGVLSPALALAVWGHDLIYDPRAGDNEARSAQVFGAWLATQGAVPAHMAQIRALILATQHTAAPATREEALLVDADLGILGASPADFAAYDAAIRQEYRHVPGPLYRIGRRKVLQGFLKRGRIYTTPEFAELEAQARANLAVALSKL